MDFCSTFIVISFYSFSSSYSGSKTPLQSFLGIAEQHTAHNGVSLSSARALTSTHTHHLHCFQPPLMNTVTYCSLSIFLLEQRVPVRQSSQPHSHYSWGILQPGVQLERPRHWTSHRAYQQSSEVRYTTQIHAQMFITTLISLFVVLPPF